MSSLASDSLDHNELDITGLKRMSPVKGFQAPLIPYAKQSSYDPLLVRESSMDIATLYPELQGWGSAGSGVATEGRPTSELSSKGT